MAWFDTILFSKKMKATRNETCIRAQWLWLIYPAILVAVTVVFLWWTIAHMGRYGGSRQDYKITMLPLIFSTLGGLHAEGYSQPVNKSLAEVKKDPQLSMCSLKILIVAGSVSLFSLREYGDCEPLY